MGAVRRSSLGVHKGERSERGGASVSTEEEALGALPWTLPGIVDAMGMDSGVVDRTLEYADIQTHVEDV